GVDFVSLALGDSSSYLGSVGIVPPPPLAESLIAEHGDVGTRRPPVIMTSRIVDPSDADRLIGEGKTDAVGMARALIADPELPAKARAGRSDEIVRCIGCNACIAHYHAGTAIACAVNPRTGRELSFQPLAQAKSQRRIVVVGGGPAGIAAAVEASSSGHSVVLFERADGLGGQLALASRTPGNADAARAFVSMSDRRVREGGVEVRLQAAATVDDVVALRPDAVVVATGARPFADDRIRIDGVESVHAWDILAGPVPSGRTVVVADWGGDQGGLAAAELLAAAGTAVTLAVESVAVGEAVHQYRRNLYLQRLYRAGVEIAHHVRLAGAADGRVQFQNVFAPDRAMTFPADLLVIARGRVPDDELSAPLAATGARVETAGDCCSPRPPGEA